MMQRLGPPTDTLQELLDLHAACKRESILVFMELSFKGDNQEFQKRVVVKYTLAFTYPDTLPSGMRLSFHSLHPKVHILFIIERT
jgi:hypothetical protein